MLKRRLFYVIMNGTLAVSLYFGFVNDVTGAENIGLFMAWLAILGGFVVSFNTEARKKSIAAGKSVPDWINAPFDIGVACALIWVGAWVTGFFWVVHILLILEVHQKPLDKSNELV